MRNLLHQSHQLTRKTNDSHSRTIDHQNRNQNSNHSITTGNGPSNVASVTKRPFDLLQHPLQDLINHSSKKLKPSQTLHPIGLSPLKLVPKESSSNRNQIHVNITTNFKPIHQKNPKEKTPQVDLQKTSWESIRSVLQSNSSSTKKQANDVTRQCDPTRSLQSLKPVVPSSVPKPIQSHQVSSPLNTIWIPNKPLTKPPKVDLKKTILEPHLRATKPIQSIRPVDSSALLTPPISVHNNQFISPTVSPPNNKRKNRNLPTGQLFNRAKKIIESDRSSLRIWQSDLEAGASLRGTKTKKLQITKVILDKGTQIVHGIEINKQDQLETQSFCKVFLRGDSICKENDQIKLFYPWIEVHDQNLIISNRYIIL